MEKSAYDIVANLILTEKAALLKEKGQYAFKVAPKASKLEIASAVAKLYNVKVKSVNLMNYAGKAKRSGKSPVKGFRSSWKKAIVTLAEGSIELS